MPFPPIVAFGFANLAMLGWLGAAAAPILIHLWMRQTHRETAWAAIRFLKAALERQARRLRLQHWILLAVRTLLLAFVALAAAKPLLDSGLLGGGLPTHRVLVLDASLSMNARDAENETALAKAKRLAGSLVDSARAGDTFSLVVMGADAGTPIGRPTSDASTAQRAIDAIAPSQGVADLRLALASSQRLIDAAENVATGRRHEVVFFTDMGPNTWGLLAEEKTTSASLSDAYEAIAAVADVSVLDVGDSTLPSVAVTALTLSDGLPTLAAPVEVRGEVQLFGNEAAERVVELLIDGSPVAEQRVTLTPGQAVPINFYHGFETPGPRAISLRLADTPGVQDRLVADNERHVAVTLRKRVKVLCVAGSPEAADYLADALDPTGEGVFEPVVVADADLPTIPLADYACVFLSNVRELSESEADRLRRYAEAGGGVAWFLGDRVNANRYNETLGPNVVEPMAVILPLRDQLRRVSLTANSDAAEVETTESLEALLPGRLSPSVAVPSYRVDPLDYAHPIVRPFRGQERAGLLTTPVARHFPLTVPQTASVALALENGDPLLVTGAYGRGRVAVLTTAATLASVDPATGEAWTALPAWPSFLPIVRELVRYLASDGGASTALLVGDPLVGQVEAANAESIVVTTPNGAEPIRITPDSNGTWAYASTKQAGVYRFGPQGEPPTAATAVNVDPGESDPASVPADRLPASLRVRRTAGESSTDSVAGANPTPIHRWLLYGALALALVEPALACLFGRGSG